MPNAIAVQACLVQWISWIPADGASPTWNLIQKSKPVSADYCTRLLHQCGERGVEINNRRSNSNHFTTLFCAACVHCNHVALSINDWSSAVWSLCACEHVKSRKLVRFTYVTQQDFGTVFGELSFAVRSTDIDVLSTCVVLRCVAQCFEFRFV